MQIRPHMNALRVLSALMLTLLLATQVVQAAHVHADHVNFDECQVCSMDGGQAAPAANNRLDAFIHTQHNVLTSRVLLPASAEDYVNVRGPPTVSL